MACWKKLHNHFSLPLWVAQQHVTSKFFITPTERINISKIAWKLLKQQGRGTALCMPTTVCGASEYLSCCSDMQEKCTTAISSICFCGCHLRLSDSHDWSPAAQKWQHHNTTKMSNDNNISNNNNNDHQHDNKYHDNSNSHTSLKLLITVITVVTKLI